MSGEEEVGNETLSKAAVKRKYLLTDDDLEDLEYELKDNPINKKYRKFKNCTARCAVLA